MSRVMRVLVFILVHLLLHAKLMWSGGQFGWNIHGAEAWPRGHLDCVQRSV